MFVFIDGDDIGASLERAIWSDDVHEYVRRSVQLTEFFRDLADDLADVGAIVLAVGGDSILATVPPEALDAVSVLLSRRKRQEATVCFSAGFGATLSSAHTALRVAKSSGKARVSIR